MRQNPPPPPSTTKPNYLTSHNYNIYNQNQIKSGYITKMKSPSKYTTSNQSSAQIKNNNHKRQFIQPGKPCPNFQEILSTTTTEENGVTTYLIAKSLSGPSLHYASQVSSTKQPIKKPSKQLPPLPKPIFGFLQPHLYTYSTLTHEGLYRKSNQDKLTIYLQQSSKWFSIYDGHGGTACSQFMKQHLHQYFFQLNWKTSIPNSLRQAFIHAQSQWKNVGDHSGTCALVIFIYLNMCYVANLGDSRAVLVSDGGKKCYQITKDHKPSNPDQQIRITQAGGTIYQTTAITQSNNHYQMIVGPLRVLPGRLSITRVIGNFQAKDTQKQGNDEVIICQPQITSFQIDSHDLIIMGSDGLWERMDNVQLVQIIQGFKEQGFTGEQLFTKATQTLLSQSLNRGSIDNISIILIGLTDPHHSKSPKKGNQHIKILGSMLSPKKYQHKNKQNTYPNQLKDLDSRILEINRNAHLLVQARR